MGPSLSQQTFAAGPFAVRAKVPVIGPSNTAKGIPQIGEFVSRVSAPVAIVAPNAVKAAMEINKDLKRSPCCTRRTTPSTSRRPRRSSRR